MADVVMEAVAAAVDQPTPHAAHSPQSPQSAADWPARVAHLEAQLARAAAEHAAECAIVDRRCQQAEAERDAAVRELDAVHQQPQRQPHQADQLQQDALAQSAKCVATTPAELSALSHACFPELRPLLDADEIEAEISPQLIYVAASVHLDDSFHCRSITHGTSLRALNAYLFIHISKWKAFVRLVGWMHLLMGFIEPPSSLMVNGVRLGPSHAVCGVLELLCLSVYAFHASRQWLAYGADGYKSSPWRICKLLVLAICFVDVLVSMARDLDTPGVHLSQLLRVLFVLEQSGRMRQLCSCILKSLPAVISIMFLCLIHVFVFGVVGFLFVGPLESYSDINTEDSRLYFSSLGRSILSTLVLLTSANFPSVMLPSYREHWFVCLFFVAFIGIGLYGLLQLTTAVVFHSFQLHTKERLRMAMAYRERALQAAFTLLSEHTNGAGFIGLEPWVKLLEQLRPDFTPAQADILFRAATNNRVEEEQEGHQGAGLDLASPAFDAYALPASAASSLNAPSSLADHDAPIIPSALSTSHVGNEAGSCAFADAACPSGEEPEARMSFVQFEAIVRFTQTSFRFTEDDSITTGVRARHTMAEMESTAGDLPMVNLYVSNATFDSGDSRPRQVRLPLLARYFTYRVPIPCLLLQLMGRSEAFIRDREAEEEPSPSSHHGDGRRDAPTPLHPPLSVRTRLTTFSLTESVSDGIVLAHMSLLVARMVLESSGSEGTLHALNVVALLLEAQFALEVLAKLWICRGSFFRSPLQVLDLVATLAVWLGQLLLLGRGRGSSQDAISCIRLARCFRLYHRLSSFTLLLRVVSQVLPPLVALLGVLFLLLYSYSVIGMMFFANALSLGKVPEDLAYHQSDFYALNFDDLAHALVALFHQSVVNDWWLVMEAVVARTHDSARLYFVSFYAVSTLVVFSVCTAFVVEAFLAMSEVQDRLDATRKAAARDGDLADPATPTTIPLPLPVSLAPTRSNEANKLADVHRSGVRARAAHSRATSDRLSNRAPSRLFRQAHEAVHQRASLGSQRHSTASTDTTSYRASSQLRRSVSPQARTSSASVGPGVHPNLPDRTSSSNTTSVPLESVLLSRISRRARHAGLRVRLRPSGGMLNTLRNMAAFRSTHSDHDTQEPRIEDHASLIQEEADDGEDDD